MLQPQGILPPVLTMKHVLVQQVCSLLHSLLAVPVHDWSKEFPTLKSFAQETLYATRLRGYRLTAGAGMAHSGGMHTVRFPITYIAPLDGGCVAHVTNWKPWMLPVAQVNSTFRLLGDPIRNMQLRLRADVEMPLNESSAMKLILEGVHGRWDQLLEPEWRPSQQRPLTLVRERPRRAAMFNSGLPPIRTVQDWELPADHKGGTNYPALAALLTVCSELPSEKQPPMIKIEGASCLVVLLADAFDGRPLTMGAYSLEDFEHNVGLHGALFVNEQGDTQPFTPELCAELYSRGTTVCRQAMVDAEYVREVLETSVCTLGGEVIYTTLFFLLTPVTPHHPTPCHTTLHSTRPHNLHSTPPMV